MSKDSDFLIDLVKKANVLITDDLIIKAKDNEGDLVTNFDYEIEKYMIERIKEKYPGFTIVSEEFNENNKLTDNCFTIDPIDGTVNFSNGLPLWGIQVACIKNSQTIASVIYLPSLNELYYADESGAYLNNKKIHVNDYGINRGMYTVTAKDAIIGEIKMRELNKNNCNFCACINFAWVAAGRLGGAMFRKDSLWDYIPGQFLVKQAGGVTYNESGSHVAANNKEFLETLKERASFNKYEEVKIVKKNN